MAIDEKKLIDADELISRLEEYIELNNSYIPRFSGKPSYQKGLYIENITYKEIIYLVNNMAKLSLQNKIRDNWIPYDNKHEKPSKVGRYRVTELDFLMTRIVNFRFWNGYRFEGCEEIIAWQPNPKPYKGEWKNEID